jgi:hypothetical protein
MSRVNVEAIGLAAVVLALILVALELRQNMIALEGQAVLDLNAATSDLLDLFWFFLADFGRCASPSWL